MKVLYFIPGTGVGGIGKFVKDVVSILSDKIDFTFVTLGDPDTDLSNFLKSHGKFLNYKRWGIDVLKGLNNELKSNHYDVVHAHLGCWSFVCLCFARFAGVKVRIAHSHSADSFKSLKFFGKGIMIISRIMNPLVVTKYLACSNHACRATFGNYVLHSDKYSRFLNPIDDRFLQKNISNIREELNIPIEDTVVTHVGYMGYHKNHRFIINLANELKNENISWLLVGDGYLMSTYEDMANKLGLKKVLFLGIRNDVPDILNITDIFILPSLLEGLGTAVLEAQAAGIQCVVSENVTNEVDLGLGLVKKIQLSEIEAWKTALKKKNIKKISQDTIRKKLIECDVELQTCADKLLKIYEQ